MEVESPRYQAKYRSIVRWVSSLLKKGGFEPITNINKDFKDGTKLMQLISVLTKSSIPRHNKKCIVRAQLLDNVRQALDMVKKAGVSSELVRSEHLVDGNEKMIFGLLWAIFKKHTLGKISKFSKFSKLEGKEGKRLNGKELLFKWVQINAAPLPVTNFTSDWMDGKVLCSILNNNGAMTDDSFSKLGPAEPSDRINFALGVAEKQFDVPRLLEVDQFLFPDSSDILLYAAELCTRIESKKPEGNDSGVSKIDQTSVSEENLKLAQAGSERFRKELDSEKKKSAELRERLLALEEKFARFTANRAEEVNATKCEIEECRQEKLILQALADSEKMKLLRVVEDNENLKKEIDAKVTLLANLEKDNEKLRKQIQGRNSLLTTDNEQLKKQIGTKAAVLTILEKENAELKKQINHHNTALTTSEMTNGELKKQIHAKNTVLTRLERDIERLNKRIYAKDSDLTKFKKDIEKLKEQIHAKDGVLTALAKGNEELRIVISGKQDVISRLQEDLKHQVQQHEVDKKAFLKKFEDQNKQINKLTASSKKSKKDCSCKKTKNELKDCEEEKKAKDLKIREMHNQMVHLSARLKAALHTQITSNPRILRLALPRKSPRQSRSRSVSPSSEREQQKLVLNKMEEFTKMSPHGKMIKHDKDNAFFFGGKKIHVYLKSGELHVRVGGGYVSLKEFAEKYTQMKLQRQRLSAANMLTAVVVDEKEVAMSSPNTSNSRAMRRDKLSRSPQS